MAEEGQSGASARLRTRRRTAAAAAKSEPAGTTPADAAPADAAPADTAEPVEPPATPAPGATPASGRPRRWWHSPLVALMLIAIALGLLVGGYTAYYQASRPAVYSSSAALLIDQEPAVFSTDSEGVLAKLARLRTKYVSLVGTTTFDKPVGDSAGLSVPQVHGALSATADPTTLLIVITAKLHEPGEAQQLAQSAAQYLSQYLDEEQTTAGISKKDRVTLTIVTPAQPGTKVAPSNKKALLEGVVVFAVITVAGALGADLLRRRRKA